MRSPAVSRAGRVEALGHAWTWSRSRTASNLHVEKRLSFIPYLGPAIIVAVLFVIGLLSFPSLTDAFVAPIIWIVVTTLEGQIITPMIIGHRLTLNPFLVFLSVAFWAWMWGALGAFLAVPLVYCRRCREETSFRT